MKLGVIYTVFNGLELVEKSMLQIKKHVDEIVIAYQPMSNRGSAMDFIDTAFFARLIDKYPEFHYIKFSPNLSIDTKTNELNKHNLGLKKLKELGCTHFMLSAVDHFYETEQFIKAKERAKEFDVTLTSMYTYYKNPTWQITPIEDYYMPFICKIYPETQYVKKQWQLKVDPSVRVNTDKSMYLFREEEIMMHHYSMIRLDIQNKFNNAAASSRWGDKAKIYFDEYNNATLESKLAYFGNRGLKEVPNYFGL